MKNIKVNLIAVLSTAGMITLGAGTTVAGHSVADINDDGHVTTEKVVAYVQMNFIKTNTNNGGRLSAK